MNSLNSALQPAITTAFEPGLNTALRELASTESLLVGLDFDGCLAPLVNNPMAARMLPASALAIRELIALERTEIALISGRTLTALVQLSDPPAGSYLAGSHGAERGHVGVGGHLTLTPAALTGEQQNLRTELTKQLEQISAKHPGSRLEFKDISVSMHTRGIDPEVAASALSATERGPGQLPGVRRRPGHDVLELAVVHITKGDALSDFQELTSATGTFYAGDDATDEDAFEVLGEEDLGIRVGTGETAAKFRVADPQAMADILTALAQYRREFLQENNAV